MIYTPGPWVRLWGVHTTQLPETSAQAEDVRSLLASLIEEALPFLDDAPTSHKPEQSSPWKYKSTKRYEHSDSPVDLYQRTVSARELQAVAKDHPEPLIRDAKHSSETWFLRRSLHRNAAEAGTASWEEWVRYFKEKHAEAEKEFTPTVLRTRRLHEWDCGALELPAGGSTWTDWTLKLEESEHKMPAPLHNRLFPVVQATCAARDRHDFLVVQVAVRRTPEEDGGSGGGDGPVLGVYTSVERIRRTEEGSVEWLMATASDAAGVLPAWVQRAAVPGQIAKDVNMFLKWVATERKGKRREDPVLDDDDTASS
ncbi:hypothetical protein B0I35DRAFT_473338 [Stachybotrys elegans]|uniref:DUF3074 domain-containing protein n=1 Tax=Stachybotrys elegans TaxID=80388 RepID=A0A8K0T796_9HYPO|nr:hypothetical protein B0I35DRAFT_473338 [Stachybotrys elegans]